MDAPACLNCATPVPGRFCPACGQRREQRPLRLLPLLGEMFAEVLDSDARVWRTLRTLLLRPGALTNAWVQGRRAAYLPPFRLYFVLNVLTFLVLSLQAGDLADDVQINGGVVANTASEGLRARLEELEDLPADTPGLAERLQGLEQALDALEPGPDATSEANTLHLGSGESWLVDMGYPEERVRAVVEQAQADPRAFLDMLYERLPMLMILLLPLLATLLRVVYLLAARPWVVHLVALVHLHAFAFLVILLAEGFAGLGELLGALGLAQLGAGLGTAAAGAAWLAAPAYLVRWAMVVHGHGIGLAIPLAGLVAVLHLFGLFAGLVGLLLVSVAVEVVFGG